MNHFPPFLYRTLFYRYYKNGHKWKSDLGPTQNDAFISQEKYPILFKKPEDLTESQQKYYDALENLEKKFSMAKKELEKKFQEAKKDLEKKYAEAFGGTVPNIKNSQKKIREISGDSTEQPEINEEKPKQKRSSCATCGKLVLDINIHNTLVHVLTTKRSRNSPANYNFTKKQLRNHGNGSSTSNTTNIEDKDNVAISGVDVGTESDSNPVKVENLKIEFSFPFISTSQKDPQKLFCKICKCDLSLTTKSYLRKHEDSKKHKHNVRLLKSNGVPPPVVDPVEKQEKNHCAFCNRIFKTLKTRLFHEKIKHKDLKWYNGKYR